MQFNKYTHTHTAFVRIGDISSERPLGLVLVIVPIKPLAIWNLTNSDLEGLVHFRIMGCGNFESFKSFKIQLSNFFVRSIKVQIFQRFSIQVN